MLFLHLQDFALDAPLAQRDAQRQPADAAAGDEYFSNACHCYSVVRPEFAILTLRTAAKAQAPKGQSGLRCRPTNWPIMKILRGVLIASSIAAIAQSAAAQSWPVKPIRMIVSNGPDDFS